MSTSASTLSVSGILPDGGITANLLLAVMGGADRWLRTGAATVVDVRRGETIARRSEIVRDVFFPESAVFGVVSRVPDGRLLQTLSIGREGSTAAVSLIDQRSISDIVVQLPGRALRISTDAFAAEVAASPAFASAVRHHARRLFEDAQSEIACVNYHDIRSRVANWLLTNAERFEFEPLPVTHQMLANILGVRRPTISDVTGELMRKGSIEHSRKSARVVNPEALRAECCACYRPTTAFREEYLRFHSEMLGETRNTGPAVSARIPPATVAAARTAYAAAVQALAEAAEHLGEAGAVRITRLAAAELRSFETNLRAYVCVLRDEGQSPERTLALIKSPIESWRLLPVARERIGQMALRWMIEEYYTGPRG